MSNIRVFENNAPLLTVRIKRKMPDGTTEPYLLDTATAIDIWVKAAKADPDTSALFRYQMVTGAITIVADGTAVDAKYSEITIQCQASDLATPATHVFHIDVTKTASPDTVMSGYFIIENI